MNIYLSGIGYYTETKNGQTIEKWDKIRSVNIPNVFISHTMRFLINIFIII